MTLEMPARSDAKVTTVKRTRADAGIEVAARRHERRFRAHLGVRAGELSAVERALLKTWALALVQTEFGAARLSMTSLGELLAARGLGTEPSESHDEGDLNLGLLNDDEQAQLAALVRKAGGDVAPRPAS